MSEAERLAGRVAIVTGGARGVGAAICQRLVAEGASVVVADSGVGVDGRDPDPSVAAEFADRLGTLARAFSDNLAVPIASRKLVELAMAEFGGVDIVVNNAAILRDAFVFKTSVDDWDSVLRANLSAAYYLLGAATPIMRDQAKAARGGLGDKPAYTWGRIINIGSSAAFAGNYGQAPYASAKGGLTALSRIAALDMARSGVTSNTVVPFAHTRVTEIIKPANEAQAAYKERALKVPTHHIATLVAYLCSDAGRTVTGQILGVRGREVFLYTPPQLVARTVSPDADWTLEGLAAAVEKDLRGAFTDLRTDLELYNTDPVI
jgi:NAD(P)-dependent dehydrogenase (short-subunit alcohol dehydrogenase family)